MNTRALRAFALLFSVGLAGLTTASCAADEKNAAAAPAAEAKADALPVVGPAPAWKLTDLEGKEIGRDALKGKVVVIDFWATWCPPCVHEIPGYVELQKKYADQGLVIVGLSVDRGGEKVVKPFAEKKGINYPLAIVGSDLAELFGGVEAIPTTFLVDREGNIRHKKVGSMETDAYEALIKPLL